MRWKPVLWALLLTLMLALIPWLQRTAGFSIYYLVFLYFVFFWLTQATSWNLFSGYAGLFSFGQTAFFGTGVYTVAILVMRYKWGLLSALPVAALLAGLLAAAIGWTVFRLRSLKGELFSLFTLAIGVGGGYVANSSKWIDGGQGIALRSVAYPAVFRSMTEYLYFLGLGTALLTVAVAVLIQYSRLGRGLFAIHDDERVAEGLGVPTFRYKLIAFSINGLLAGLSGGIHAVQMNYVAVDSVFTLKFSLYAILMSVLGGTRHWVGPILGALVIHSLSDRLAGAGYGELQQVVTGLTLVVIIVFMRDGIYGRLRDRLWPSLGLMVVTMVFQLLAVRNGDVLTQLTVAMFVVLAMLLVPPKLYDRIVALWRPRVSGRSGMGNAL